MVSKAERRKAKAAKRKAWADGAAQQPTVKKQEIAPRAKQPPPAARAPAARQASGGSSHGAPATKRKAAAAAAPPPAEPAEPAETGAVSPKRPRLEQPELGQHEVYVKGVPADCTEGTLHEFFKDTRPLGIKLGRDRQTGECKGYAFLCFGSYFAAERCIEEWDGAWMGEQHVALSHAEKKKRSAAADASPPGGGRGRGRGGDRGGRGGRGRGRGSQAGGRGDSHKNDVWPGDWTCPSCGANVYASLSICYKPWCKTAKPADAVETMSGEILPAAPPAAEVAAANAATAAARAPNGGSSAPLAADASQEERTARAETLTRQIASFASQKQLGQAVATFALLAEEGLRPTVYSYSNLINAHVNSGDLRGARNVFRQLGAAGFAPNVVVFTTLLKGYAISGDLARAEELFAEMAAQAPPVPPDLRFINTFLRGCLRVGDAPRASETYRRMREEWGVAPDAASYRLLARLLSQNLQLPELRALVAEAEGAATATAAPPNAPPCMFWAQGRCDRGRNCAFWHDPAIVQDNAGQAAIEQLDTTARLQLALAHAEALLGGWAAAEEAAARAQDAQTRATEAAEEAEEELDGTDGADDEPGGSLFSRTCVALLPVDHSCLSSSSADSWAGCAGHAMSWAARSIV